MPNRTHVQLTNIYYDNVKTNSCVYGDNVRLKLKNIEEEVGFLFLLIIVFNQNF
jgi:hypothetical protein